MSRAQQIAFDSFLVQPNDYRFVYLIDDDRYEITLSHSIPSTMTGEKLDTVLFNLGMCYLMDLTEIVLPDRVVINFNLDELQLLYWQTLYKEVAKEKMYIKKLDLTLLDCTWTINNQGKSYTAFSLNGDRTNVALCLTGGKESLTLLKLLKGKKDLLLFFLNPEMNVHRQKVYERVKNEFPTVKTISNRPDLIKALKKKYDTILGSGVDMAHLVFNTLLFETSYVLIGNEYSSNFPNLVYQGYSINHQNVKSVHFAEKLNQYLHRFVTKDFTYYSPFFGLYEYKIASQLYKTDEYLEVWTSCNMTTPEVNFCSNCAKCAFSYLIGLLYTSEEFLRTYFSRDMLEDVGLFRQLMDFTAEKPLDCVGEKVEVWTALEQLSKKDNLAHKPAIDYYIKNIRPLIADELPKFEKEVNTIQTIPQTLPADIQHILDEAYA